jgi:hypothetical protein
MEFASSGPTTEFPPHRDIEDTDSWCGRLQSTDFGEPTMVAKRKSALRSINTSGIPTLRDDLKPELASIAAALTEELAALVATVLDDGRKQTLDCLSQAFSDAVPELLQRAFEQELLAGGKSAAERRASLVAVLRASDSPLPRTSPASVCNRNRCRRKHTVAGGSVSWDACECVDCAREETR